MKFIMLLLKFVKQNKSQSALLFGIGLFLFFLLVNPLTLPSASSTVLSVAVLMVSWWVLGALPLPVVALMPLVLFPLFDIASVKEVTKSYSDSVVFLFMGGFFLGIAIEKWNLHRRIALGIINITGTNGNRIILGFIIATCFLSLWLSNTATTMMMYPIALSVIQVVGSNNDNNKSMKHFSLVLMLSLAYASNFALGTIIGTPPNVAYVNYISDKYGYSIGFTDWMLVFMPLTIVLTFFLYWVLVKWLYPNQIVHSEEARSYIRSELKKLGKMSVPEKRVAGIFLVTVLCWVFKDVINANQSLFELEDASIAMFGALLLFVMPSGKKETDSVVIPLLTWDDTTKMAWGILILFGGGIALAKSLEDAQLMNLFGNELASMATGNVLLMVCIVTAASVFLSEVMSNVAQVIVMAPVVSSMAASLHMDPLMLGIPMTLGASCASMLPMGTPPNAIVFASSHIKMKNMIFAGFVLNIVSIILIVLFCYFLQPVIIKTIFHFH